jgi:hypothetical protein
MEPKNVETNKNKPVEAFEALTDTALWCGVNL